MNSPTNQTETFEDMAQYVESVIKTQYGLESVDSLSMSILRSMGLIAHLQALKEDQEIIRGDIRIHIGSILVNTIVQAAITNGISHKAYDVTKGKVLAFGGAVTGLMQASYAQYRVHAATNDIEQTLIGRNPVSNEFFKGIHHERFEALANLYTSLRTVAMDFDWSLEQCLERGLQPLKDREAAL